MPVTVQVTLLLRSDCLLTLHWPLLSVRQLSLPFAPLLQLPATVDPLTGCPLASATVIVIEAFQRPLRLPGAALPVRLLT